MGAVVRKTEIPGPRSREIFARVQASTPRAIGHLTPIAVAHAEGALITDVDGNTYIDFAGGLGVLNVGHRAPEVVSAIKDQADRYLHQCFMVAVYEPYAALCEKLNQITPGTFRKKTALFTSGAEAVENAVKIARAATGRPAVVAFDRAFHGRTLMALGLTGQVRPYKERFGPMPPEVYRAPYPYCYRCPRAPSAHAGEGCCLLGGSGPLAELFRSQVRPEEVAAVLVEPVLGEGGFVVPPPGFLPALERTCRQHGILLIADEVQSGFGRTGRLFAVEHFGVEPDLVVMAKSMAGGEVLSAVTGRAELLDALPPGALGGTYGGHPLACRAALATLSILEGGLLERARIIGEAVLRRFRQMQQRHPLIGDVRGLGAMVALELVRDRERREPAGPETAAVLRRCYQNGLLALRAGADGNVIRALMPLVITEAELAEGLDILEEALSAPVAGSG